ncbi:hypothetical protein C8R42DRAFT_439149 [Lentinula raphanica]|nr:hypothetical protein C8R42DRAFT_439149 [Lentinula raphanica]
MDTLRYACVSLCLLALFLHQPPFLSEQTPRRCCSSRFSNHNVSIDWFYFMQKCSALSIVQENLLLVVSRAYDAAFYPKLKSNTNSSSSSTPLPTSVHLEQKLLKAYHVPQPPSYSRYTTTTSSKSVIGLLLRRLVAMSKLSLYHCVKHGELRSSWYSYR